MRDDGRSVRGLVVLIIAAALAGACADEVARVGPELQITGESTKLRAHDPLPRSSPIFDGARVHVRAARGEVLGLIVWRAATDVAPVALAIDGTTVVGYQVAHHRVRRPSTEMYGPSDGGGAWPDRLDVAPAGPVPVTRAGFFEVTVPRDAAPIVHHGTLTVGARTIPVELRVDAVVLPPIEDAPRLWAYFDPRETARAGGVAPGSDAGLALELQFAALLRRYGVAASPDLSLDDWPRRRELVRGLPWVPVVLPAARAEQEAAVRGWVDALAGTGQRPFAIPIDEPRRLWMKLAVRELAGRVRAAGRGELLYAVTDAPHFVYGDLVDVYISPLALTLGGGRAIGGASPERWTYNGAPPFAGAMILDTNGVAMRTWGWIGWRWRVPLWYVWDAAYWSDRHNARRRGLTKVAGMPAPTAIDDDAVTFDDGEDHGNLDGALAFWTPAGPAPSLRLAALRRGLQDRALLEALEACAGRDAADAIAKRLVPTALGDAGGHGTRGAGAWPLDEAPWEAARQEILDALAACPDAAIPP